MCDKIFTGKECADGQCEDRHPYKCRNYKTVNGCTWGSKCEFLHAAPNTADAFTDDKVVKEKDALDYELELGSGALL